ncbi:hypothetical protein [Streptomyces sp. NRRL F-5126]|uniref:hypothetical protein n=1 Tax=Streptomyces sp. NRRL F-5126 TaxID=1463857 RepID=UPI000AA6E7EA|nr:hypothetical protein [Streptomyces sp. NRRL F-5126]
MTVRTRSGRLAGRDAAVRPGPPEAPGGVNTAPAGGPEPESEDRHACAAVTR